MDVEPRQPSAIDGRPARRRRGIKALVAIGILSLVALYGYDVWRHNVQDVAVVRQELMAMRLERLVLQYLQFEDEPLIPSVAIALLAAPDEPLNLPDRWHPLRQSLAYSIGGATLGQWRASGAPVAQLRAAISAGPPIPVWEQIGGVVWSRERAAHTSYDRALIVGFALPARHADAIALAFADGHAETLRLERGFEPYERAWAQALRGDTEARLALNISPLPDIRRWAVGGGR